MNQIPNNEKPLAIQKIKPKGKKYIVVINDEELLISEDVMVEYRLSLSRRLTNEELVDLKKTMELSTAFEMTIGFINFKMRSESEVREYLKKKDLTPNAIDTIIERLKSHHFIDDDRYQKALCDDCYHKLKGRFALKQALSEKGFKEKDIIEIINQYDEEKMLDDLIDKYQRKAETLTNLPLFKQKQTIKEAMFRRGFSEQTINSVLGSIDFNEDLSSSFIKDLKKITTKTSDYNKQVAYLMSKGYAYQMIKEHLKK